MKNGRMKNEENEKNEKNEQNGKRTKENKRKKNADLKVNFKIFFSCGLSKSSA